MEAHSRVGWPLKVSEREGTEQEWRAKHAAVTYHVSPVTRSLDTTRQGAVHYDCTISD